MQHLTTKDKLETENRVTVLSRSLRSNSTLLRLSNGETLVTRRFIPVGKGDYVRKQDNNFFVFVKTDQEWLEVGRPWSQVISWDSAEKSNNIIFKEIDEDEDYRLFDDLRKFHYRGGGGAGRTVPIIATTDTWDLPQVLGFIEISSSMIANTARKKFFNHPYWEADGLGWAKWDRAATKKYSNMIARISRFVIHPEIRGLGLARYFLKAAGDYAAEKWHYGGFRPRFLEITADMLRYYQFVGPEFIYIGETEGNEHRISKDMAYLVKKALSPEGSKAMPQGGGGIMTLQRSYASQLIKHMETHRVGLSDVVNELRYEPKRLDQDTWEALYRLNRRPKPCYVTGLNERSKKYLERRKKMLAHKVQQRTPRRLEKQMTFRFQNISVLASAKVAQTNEARRIQDAFGFVGSEIEMEIVQPISFDLKSGSITLICGASGSGKSVFGRAMRCLCEQNNNKSLDFHEENGSNLEIGGSLESQAFLVEIAPLDYSKTPLDQMPKVGLEEFISTGAKCGLAEPQLFVRPTSSLSSGQRYRLQLAFAVLKRPDILYIDNFCETLDRFTALAVCRGLKSLACERNISVVVATASYERVLEMMQPDQTILLRRGNVPVVTSKTGD